MKLKINDRQIHHWKTRVEMLRRQYDRWLDKFVLRDDGRIEWMTNAMITRERIAENYK